MHDVSYFVHFRIQHLIEAGFVEYWKELWFPSLHCQRGAHVEAKTISLKDIAGVFLLLAIGIIIAFAVLMVEHVCALHKQLRH